MKSDEHAAPAVPLQSKPPPINDRFAPVISLISQINRFGIKHAKQNFALVIMVVNIIFPNICKFVLALLGAIVTVSS